MAPTLTDAQRALFDAKNFAHVATTNADGSPQVSPVWVAYDGTHVLFNSEKKRLKIKNLTRDGRVAVSVLDAENPYRYVEVRGKVVEITENGANDDIDRMCLKYTGNPKYPWHKPDDVRVIVKILPEKIAAMGF